MKTITISVMMIGLILACQNATLTPPQDKNTVKNQLDKQISLAGSIPEKAIPPIDMAVPTKTETATFALG